jgi:hypothetical protein
MIYYKTKEKISGRNTISENHLKLNTASTESHPAKAYQKRYYRDHTHMV